ncbi:MAG: lysoplasmalogenase family protein [Oscillospiraceae bacterium]|nr:lysoplasmalogenase family protein [Oscillospiraceae bacterium]MDD4413003.1 lysoplasmalogenase family protein [Oscillospiraceae bacterium]
MTEGIRIFLYIFPAVMLFFALLPLFFKLKQQKIAGSATVVKAFCSLVPVIFCLNGCVVNGFRGFWWILAGLSLCLVGDIITEQSKSTGLKIFTVANLLFIYAFTIFAKPTVSAAQVFLFLLAMTALIFRRQLRKPDRHFVPLLIYAVVLLFMVSLSLTLPVAVGTVLIATGALLIAISNIIDAKVFLKSAEKNSRLYAIRLGIYYAGLYLFALAVWL